jgi:hypothetical protein
VRMLSKGVGISEALLLILLSTRISSPDCWLTLKSYNN